MKLRRVALFTTAVLAIPAGIALNATFVSAHVGSSHDETCATVSAHMDAFPSGDHVITITSNTGDSTTRTLTGPAGDVTAPWSDIGVDTTKGGTASVEYTWTADGGSSFGPFSYDASKCATPGSLTGDGVCLTSGSGITLIGTYAEPSDGFGGVSVSADGGSEETANPDNGTWSASFPGLNTGTHVFIIRLYNQPDEGSSNVTVTKTITVNCGETPPTTTPTTTPTTAPPTTTPTTAPPTTTPTTAPPTTAPPQDVCVDLPGQQTKIPAGYQRGANNTCPAVKTN